MPSFEWTHIKPISDELYKEEEHNLDISNEGGPDALDNELEIEREEQALIGGENEQIIEDVQE